MTLPGGASRVEQRGPTTFRSRFIVVAGMFALAGIGLITFWPVPREPTWDGQTLSDWLQYGYGAGMTHSETDREVADAAVRQIGTNALPILIRELGDKYSHRRWQLVQLLKKQSIIPVRYMYPDERRARALGAFHALGKMAAPALPQIRLYLTDPELRGDAERAISAILEISGEADDQETVTTRLIEKE